MSNRDIRATTVPLKIHNNTWLSNKIDSRLELARQLYNIFIQEGYKRFHALKKNCKWEKIEDFYTQIRYLHKNDLKKKWYYEIRNERLYRHGLTGSKCFDCRFNNTFSVNAQLTNQWINEFLPGNLRSRIVRDASQRWHEAMHPTRERPFRGLPKTIKQCNVLMGRDGYRKKDNSIGKGIRFKIDDATIVIDSSSGKHDIVIPVDLSDHRAQHAFNVINGKPNPGRKDVYWIKRQIVRGKKRYFLVVMHENGPLSNHNITPMKNGIAGIDIGATYHWIVGEYVDMNNNKCGYVDFFKMADVVTENKVKKLKQYRAKLKNSQYGSKNSIRYKDKIQELSRKIVEEKKNVQNQLINSVVLKFGQVKTEDVLCNDWNKSQAFGGQVRKSSPGKFWRRLDHICKTYNIPLEKHNCSRTRLSQHCACGYDFKINDMNQRAKKCPECGLVIHRDMLAAILIAFTTNGITDFKKAQEFIKLYCNQLAERWWQLIKMSQSAGTKKDVLAFCKIYGLNIDDAGKCWAVDGIS